MALSVILWFPLGVEEDVDLEGDFFEADAGLEEAVLFFVFVLVDGEDEEAEEEGLVLACCFCLLGEGRFLGSSVAIFFLHRRRLPIAYKGSERLERDTVPLTFSCLAFLVMRVGHLFSPFHLNIL